MNDIGYGFFCFGEQYYFKGVLEKIKEILKHNTDCYILTDNPGYFTSVSSEYLYVFKYEEKRNSYHDKMILPQIILQNHDYCILIDADLHIKDYSFISKLSTYQFKPGISYIDTLANHPCKKEKIGDLINEEVEGWNTYIQYLKDIYPDYTQLDTLWEYFIILNRKGFNFDAFYYLYEKLQLVREYPELDSQKEVIGSGEGISIQVASILTDTDIQRDTVLYEMLKDNFTSISRRFTRPDLWPEWMKDD